MADFTGTAGALGLVLRAYLKKLGPFTPPAAPLVLYTLLIEGAAVGPGGAVVAEGEGVLVGPLDLRNAAAALAVLEAHPGHAPELRGLVERREGGNIVIVTCHIAPEADAENGYVHYAIVKNA